MFGNIFKGNRWQGFKKLWVPAILYAGFIFYQSSLPYPLEAVVSDMSVLHVPLFFVFSYMLARALSGSGIRGRNAIVAAIVVTALYGVLDEVHQLYVPGRTFSYSDMGFDFLGGCLIVFKAWWEKLFEKVNL